MTLRKIVLMLTVCFALSVLPGCNSVNKAFTKAITGKENYAMQIVPVPDQSARLSDPDKCRVYLIRDTSAGWAAGVEIFDNGIFIGGTHGGTYLCWEREPGRMALTTATAGTQLNMFNQKLTVDLQKGQVYYIQQTMWFGGKLKLVSEDKGLKILKKCSVAAISNPQQSGK